MKPGATYKQTVSQAGSQRLSYPISMTGRSQVICDSFLVEKGHVSP